MKRLSRLLAATVVTVVAAGSLSAVFAGSAFASGNPPWEPLTNPPEAGGLLFFNSSGTQITSGTVNQPLAAYVVGTGTLRTGDSVATLEAYTPVDGIPAGEWSGEQLSGSTDYPNASAPSPINTTSLPVVTESASDETIAQYEGDYPNNDTSGDGYAGIYVIRLITDAPDKPATTSYDSADIQVTGDTWSVVYSQDNVTSTTTSLTTSPASPQVSGTSVTLTATVSPSAATGTVQFEYGSTDIGSPVTVSGGTASISTTSLPVGTDDLSAVFTPATLSGYGGSTGTASYTINPPPAAGTTTALTVDPSSAPAYTSVSLTAAVTVTSTSAPISPSAGSVSFYDDGTDTSGDITSDSVLLGTEALGTGGVASLSSSTFAQGAHNIVAAFVPSDPSVYDTSSSPAVLFTATAPTYTPHEQDLSVAIPPGTLTITTPYTPSSPFDLGTATLNPGQGTYSASAPFGSSANPADGITITDTGIGEDTWTASASVTDFSDGGSDSINGQNLTFTGVTPSYVTGNAYGSGAGQIPIDTEDVTNDGTVYASGASGSDGLKGGPHQFAESTEPGGGTVYVYGNLDLTAPSSVTPGTYTATLTFTVA